MAVPHMHLLRRAGVGVCFDVAPLLVYDAAQLALHCFERVVNGFGQRRMRAVIHLLFSGNQFVPWSHRHIDADVIRISLLMAWFRCSIATSQRLMWSQNLSSRA